MRRARRGSPGAGFTLMELVISALIAMLVISGLYAVYATHSRIFRGQEMVSAAQFSARYAMETIRGDLQRAGFGATFDSADPQVQQKLCVQPAVGPIKAIQLTNGNPALTQAIWANNLPPNTIGPPASVPDILTLVGNYLNEEAYEVDRFAGSNVFLEDNFASDSTEPFPQDANVFARLFQTGGQTLVRIRDREKTHFSLLNGATHATKLLTLATAPSCGMSPDWAQVNLVHQVRYQVVPAILTNSETAANMLPGIANRFDLVREFLNWTTGAVVTREVVAENVVDFQVWFLFDTGATPSMGPTVSQVPVFNLPDANSGGPPCNANAIGTPVVCPIKNIYAAVVRISVRTPHEDPNWVIPTAPPLRKGLFYYEVAPNSRGAARVRSLISRVELPNITEGL